VDPQGRIRDRQPEHSLTTARRLVAATNCVVVLPDYRISVDAPYPAALDDCYHALRWLRDHAGELGAVSRQARAFLLDALRTFAGTYRARQPDRRHVAPRWT
jgi:hypothetical protein